MARALPADTKADQAALSHSIVEAISGGHFEAAKSACEALEALDPTAPDAWVFRARIAQQQSDYRGAAAMSEKARVLAPNRLDVLIVDCECRMFAGDVAGAIAQLNQVTAAASASEEDLKRASALFTQLGRHQTAYDCALRVHELANGGLNSKYLVASTALAVGKLNEAQQFMDEVIADDPGEGDVYYNRSGLRRQSLKANHLEEIMKALLNLPRGDPRETPLCYALGKEFEDIGDHSKAFAAFAQGARSRRTRLSYDVATDCDAAANIIKIFDQRWAEEALAGFDKDGPIFVLGLPRSGTTLVDRIISSHSQVTSLEEIHDFAYAVIRAGFPAASKTDLMARSAQADLCIIGREYWTAVQGYGEPGPYFIDKTPANFLYLGLIAKALPAAKIVHLRRHPLASCYAMFKTLFRMGYPFSYDLSDVAHYYLAYDKLMAHWHQLLPGRIFDVQYEALIDQQEDISRQIIAHCGLAWEEACLNFHTNAAPTATASAAQVRQPIYKGSRDLWRRYSAQLEPARDILEKGGISCD